MFHFVKFTRRAYAFELLFSERDSGDSFPVRNNKTSSPWFNPMSSSPVRQGAEGRMGAESAWVTNFRRGLFFDAGELNKLPVIGFDAFISNGCSFSLFY